MMKLRFDNISTAVKEIKTYGGRGLTESFRRLQCHFGFDSNFCNPAAGHKKGSVENFVGCSCRNFFVPVPEMADLKIYNQELLLRCDSRLEEEHYKLQRLVKDLFAEDKAEVATTKLIKPAAIGNPTKVNISTNGLFSGETFAQDVTAIIQTNAPT